MRNIPTELILLEIAEGLKTLISDKGLSEKIKEAYALSESERQQAQEAADLISQGDALKAELKNREDAIADINALIQKQEKIADDNAQTLSIIKIHQSELDDLAHKSALNAAENVKENSRLRKWESELHDKEKRFHAESLEIANLKADLKKRASKVKAELADL